MRYVLQGFRYIPLTPFVSMISWKTVVDQFDVEAALRRHLAMTI
jgi:hypothetical protein